MHAADFMQFIVGGGVLTGALETVRWFLGGGRNKAKVDNAKIVEAMALDLLHPLNEQVKWASGEVENLRKTLHETQSDLSRTRIQVHALQGDVEALHAWSLAVKVILDDHGIAYPPVPNTTRDH
jgi:hypothetical protein